jgi:hypothetical protein
VQGDPATVKQVLLFLVVCPASAGHSPAFFRRAPPAATPTHAHAPSSFQHAPKWVPQHVYAECERLRRMGTAATNAKAVLLLTDGELRELPHFEKDRWVAGQGWWHGRCLAR